MDENQVLYTDELLAFIVKRIPAEMINVFAEIWNNKNVGVTWTNLVNTIGDRYLVEKALLLFETNGFVQVELSTADKRQKIYLPDKIRGKQMAKYIREHNKLEA
ncbi:hypothetical protein ACFQ88_39370 [Paenibacillus sp. NPDC056579]|uniref:hypothetical protein n=1 Tax=Paenibacillus sp. NPDC056579 TaxID=3345871 RepID=UPI0036988756